MSRIHAVRCRTALTMEEGAPPLDDGCIVHADGVILDVGGWSDMRRRHGLSASHVEDLGERCVLPGLINGHTHLELSHLRSRLTRGQGFPAWVRSLLAHNPDAADPVAMQAAIDAMHETGTVHVVAIAGRNAELVDSLLDQSPLGYHLCLERLGQETRLSDSLEMSLTDNWLSAITINFKADRQPASGHDRQPSSPGGGVLSVAGHALYSTAPHVLQDAKAWCTARGLPFCLHLAEHEDETAVLATGTGEFADMLRNRLLPHDYRPPGCSPLAYAHRLGLLDAATIAVHAVQVDDEDIEILRASGATVCLCPRSNAFIGVGRAPVNAYRKTGVPICIGTDSLASNDDLNLWNEARNLAMFLLENTSNPCTLNELAAWMTAAPAKALSVDDRLGSLRPGRAAVWTCVPADILEIIPL